MLCDIHSMETNPGGLEDCRQILSEPRIRSIYGSGTVIMLYMEKQIMEKEILLWEISRKTA